MTLTERFEGMQAAVAHADDVDTGWSDRAVAAIEAIRNAGRIEGPTLAEVLRAIAYAAGLEHPPDERAWGGVMQRARRDGLLRKVGYTVSPTSGSPMTTWVAA